LLSRFGDIQRGYRATRDRHEDGGDILRGDDE
jgi:hypothetical protein